MQLLPLILQNGLLCNRDDVCTTCAKIKKYQFVQLDSCVRALRAYNSGVNGPAFLFAPPIRHRITGVLGACFRSSPVFRGLYSGFSEKYPCWLPKGIDEIRRSLMSINAYKQSLSLFDKGRLLMYLICREQRWLEGRW